MTDIHETNQTADEWACKSTADNFQTLKIWTSPIADEYSVSTINGGILLMIKCAEQYTTQYAFGISRSFF